MVIERSRYDARRVGEHLSPEALPALRELDLEHVVLDAAHCSSPSIVSYWPARQASEHPYLFSPFGHGANLSRTAFDLSLAREASARGVNLWTGSLPVRIEGGPGEWSLRLRGGDQTGRERTLHAQFLVDATGRAAWVARRMGELPCRHDSLIGIHGLVVAPDRARENSHALWIEAGENGWWYSAPLRNHEIVVVYMTDADLLAGETGGPDVVWRQRLREAPRTLERLRGLELPAKVRVAPAQSQRLARVFGRGWAAVGDAAYAFDPLSASGIRKALEDGVAVSSAVAAALKADYALLEQYQQKIVDTFARYLTQKIANYRLVQDWPHAPFWQRRHRPPSEVDRIWLDPRALVVASRSERVESAIGSLLDLCPAVDAQQILCLAAHPLPAHQLVRRYQVDNDTCTDREIIAAIQALMESGYLQRGEEA
jgi:flavin-dependent dehydrogenase